MKGRYIFYAFGLIKLFFLKVFHPFKLKLFGISMICPSVKIELGKQSKLVLHNGVSIRRNTEIDVRDHALIELGNHSFFNSNCLIVAHKKIVIGAGVEFGPGVMVFDHDHKYKNGLEKRGFESSEIIIGNNVWIGAGTIILRGSHISDNCVIAAGSVIKGNYEPGSIIYQKRNTIVSTI